MAKVAQRRIVTQQLGEESFYDILDGNTPEQVIERMQRLRAEYPGRDIYFDVNSYGYDGGKTLDLLERREENDKEFEKRMAEEKKAKAKEREAKATKEAKELAEYERLKKKFEKA